MMPCKVCGESTAQKINPLDISTLLFTASSSIPSFHTYESAYCEHCGVIFMTEFPDRDKLVEFYNNDYRASDFAIELQDGRTIDLPIQIPWSGISYARFETFYRMIERSSVQRPSSESFFIDYGGYQGFFLLAVKQCYGAEVMNYEYSQSGLQFAEGALGIPGFLSQDISKDSFHKKADFVTLLHVFEHLEAPLDFLIHVRENILKSTGSIYIEVPNVYGDALVDPTHFYTYSELSLSNMLMMAGYTVVEVVEHGFPGNQLKADNDRANLSIMAVVGPETLSQTLHTPLALNDFLIDVRNSYKSVHWKFLKTVLKRLRKDFFEATVYSIGFLLEAKLGLNLRKIRASLSKR